MQDKWDRNEPMTLWSQAETLWFPADEVLQQQWVAAMKVKNFNPKSRCTKICSDHFKPEDFVISFGLKKIRKGAVPSILDVAKKEESKPGSILIDQSKKQKLSPKFVMSKVTKNAKNISSSLHGDSEVSKVNQLPHNTVNIGPDVSSPSIAIGPGLSIPSIAIAEQVDTSEIIDWTNVCRACLSARNLHDMELLKYENLNFIQLYESLCNKKVLDNGLSKKLCNTCVASLTRFKLFLVNCDESEKKLKEVANITECSKDFEPNDVRDDISSENLLGDRPNSPVIGKSQSESPDPLIGPSSGMSSNLSEQIDEIVSYLLDQSESHTTELAQDQSKCDSVKDGFDSDADNVNDKIVHSCPCGNNFIRYDAYVQHKKEFKHSDRTMYKCEYCGKISKDRVKHITHKRVHTNEKPFVCHMCGLKFNFYNNLVRHVKSHSGIKSYICSVCGKGFTTKFMLVNHERSKHSNEKPYLCSYCGANFGGRANFTAHLRQHILRKTLARPQDLDRLKRVGIVGSDDPTPFQCDECHKYVTSQNKLRLHKVVHYTVECPECLRRFANERAMRKHRNVHSLSYTGIRKARTVRTFQCGYCKKQFKSQKDLDLHENSHTGRRPYKCEICGRDWKQPMHLRRHMMMVHTGERPYACTFCGKGYVDKCLFDAHMNAHIGVKPFTCETCPASFYDRSSLSKHRRRHREDYQSVDCTTAEPERRVITKRVPQAPKRLRKNSQALHFIVARSAHTTHVSRKRRIFYY